MKKYYIVIPASDSNKKNKVISYLEKNKIPFSTGKEAINTPDKFRFRINLKLNPKELIHIYINILNKLGLFLRIIKNQEFV